MIKKHEAECTSYKKRKEPRAAQLYSLEIALSCWLLRLLGILQNGFLDIPTKNPPNFYNSTSSWNKLGFSSTVAYIFNRRNSKNSKSTIRNGWKLSLRMWKTNNKILMV